MNPVRKVPALLILCATIPSIPVNAGQVMSPTASKANQKQAQSRSKDAMRVTSAKSGGGGMTGSGGDGLYLNAEQQGSNVVVPVPDDLQSWATLTILGTPGARQNETFSYQWCAAGSDGQPDMKHCQNSSAQLNQPVKMRSGFLVSVEYSRTRLAYSVDLPLRIDAGEALSYSLKQIQVPKVDSTYKFKVFVDYSDPKQTRMYPISQAWSNYYTWTLLYLPEGPGANVPSDDKAWNDLRTVSGTKLTDFASLCRAIIANEISSFPELISVCQAYAKNSDLLFVPTHAGPHGGFLNVNSICWLDMSQEAEFLHHTRKYMKMTSCRDINQNDLLSHKDIDEDFFWVTDPSDGDFVSVFPGVYGIKFTAQDGKESFVNGIHVD